MNFVDTHCHLNDEKFSDDLIEVIERAKSAGVNRIINFGDTLKSSAAVVELAEKFAGMFAGVGVHPEEIADFDKNSKKFLNLQKIKTSWRLAKLAWIIIGKKILKSDYCNRKFLLNSLKLRGL